MNRRVAVIGGGLAGITTALGCADRGMPVTLYESRPRLGGLTHSFRRDGLWVDNGQHVFMRCCTSYRALLDRLGVSDLVTLQPRLDVPVRSETRPGVARLRRNGLPAPLHLGAALARYRWLPPGDRIRVMRAALALGRVDPEGADERSFGDWLRAHDQSARAVETVWELIGVATLNAHAGDASLALAATVFQIGLLGRADAADLGWASVPLQRLHGDAAADALAAAGARVRTGNRVRTLLADGDRWLVDGETYDDVVVATAPVAAEALLPEGALDVPVGWSEELGSAPIVNLHLRVDRPILDEPFVAAVDGPLQWVFDRSTQAGLGPGEGQYVAVSLSAAHDLADRTVAELRAWAMPHLRALLPGIEDATVGEFFVTREPHATFRPRPGSARLRPGARTRLPGLHLAGAWTDTGWPATMEGAVRSGEAALAAIASGSSLRAVPARPHQEAS